MSVRLFWKYILFFMKSVSAKRATWKRQPLGCSFIVSQELGPNHWNLSGHPAAILEPHCLCKTGMCVSHRMDTAAMRSWLTDWLAFAVRKWCRPQRASRPLLHPPDSHLIWRRIASSVERLISAPRTSNADKKLCFFAAYDQQWKINQRNQIHVT